MDQILISIGRHRLLHREVRDSSQGSWAKELKTHISKRLKHLNDIEMNVLHLKMKNAMDIIGTGTVD